MRNIGCTVNKICKSATSSSSPKVSMEKSCAQMLKNYMINANDGLIDPVTFYTRTNTFKNEGNCASIEHQNKCISTPLLQSRPSPMNETPTITTPQQLHQYGWQQQAPMIVVPQIQHFYTVSPPHEEHIVQQQLHFNNHLHLCQHQYEHEPRGSCLDCSKQEQQKSVVYSLPSLRSVVGEYFL